MSESARIHRVGPWSFRLDSETGFIGQIRFAGHEVNVAIFPAVRDPQWETLPANIRVKIASETPQRLHLTLEARTKATDSGFRWQGHVIVEVNPPCLTYDWTAHTEREFRTNRAGLCVLHSAALAGAPCTILHPGGSTEKSHFPHAVAPHQPFFEIQSIAHSLAAGAKVRVGLEGEIFEMEDQRNWTDASFKTYSRPLAWPRPYPIIPDESVRQTVSVRILGQLSPIGGDPAPLAFPVSLPPLHPLPKLGFGWSGPVPENLRERARALRPAHLRAETSPTDIATALAALRPTSTALACGLEIAVLGATSQVPPTRPGDDTALTILPCDLGGNPAAPEVIAAWQRAGYLQVAHGTCHNFAELNRQRPPATASHDLTIFGINAQVHAFDDNAVIESSTQHGVLAHLARQIGRDHPVAVGPIRLGPHADSADQRLHTPFAAAWTLASLGRLLPEITSATYFDLHGPTGVLQPGAISPLEHLFRLLATADLAARCPINSPANQEIVALLLQGDGQHRLLVVSLRESPLEVNVPWSGRAGELGSDLQPFRSGPVTLPPRRVWQLEFTP